MLYPAGEHFWSAVQLLQQKLGHWRCFSWNYWLWSGLDRLLASLLSEWIFDICCWTLSDWGGAGHSEWCGFKLKLKQIKQVKLRLKMQPASAIYCSGNFVFVVVLFCFCFFFVAAVVIQTNNPVKHWRRRAVFSWKMFEHWTKMTRHNQTPGENLLFWPCMWQFVVQKLAFASPIVLFWDLPLRAYLDTKLC